MQCHAYWGMVGSDRGHGTSGHQPAQTVPRGHSASNLSSSPGSSTTLALLTGRWPHLSYCKSPFPLSRGAGLPSRHPGLVTTVAAHVKAMPGQCLLAPSLPWLQTLAALPGVPPFTGVRDPILPPAHPLAYPTQPHPADAQARQLLTGSFPLPVLSAEEGTPSSSCAALPAPRAIRCAVRYSAAALPAHIRRSRRREVGRSSSASSRARRFSAARSLVRRDRLGRVAALLGALVVLRVSSRV